MEEHTSYHQCICGYDAEERLVMRVLNFRSPCYLTRYSEAQKRYALTVCQPQTPVNLTLHFEIILEENGQYGINGTKRSFPDIESLLTHYEKNRIHPALETIGRSYAYAEYNQEEKRQAEEKKPI